MPAEPTAERPPSPDAPRRRGPGPAIAIGTAVVLLAVAAVVVVVLTRDDGDAGLDDPGTATGFADLSGEEIVDTAVAYMSALDTVRIQRSSENANGQTVFVDVVATPQGDCRGTIGLDDGMAELRVVKREVYVRGGVEFLTNAGYEDYGPDVVAQVTDRWHRPMELTGARFALFCDVDELIDEGLPRDDDSATYDKGETAPFEGVAGLDDGDSISVRVRGTRPDELDPTADEDDEPDAVDSTLSVSVAAPHYLTTYQPSEATSYSYSEFDAGLDVAAPPDDQVVAMVDIVPESQGGNGTGG